MRLGNYVKTIAAGSMISLTSCVGQPFKEIKPDKQTAKLITEISNETKEILKNKEYSLYGKDTIRIPNFFQYTPRALTDKMERVAAASVPDSILGTKQVAQPTLVDKAMTLLHFNQDIKAPKYVKEKAVLASPKVFVDQRRNQYVAIEYYGIPNPKLK